MEEKNLSQNAGCGPLSIVLFAIIIILIIVDFSTGEIPFWLYILFGIALLISVANEADKNAKIEKKNFRKKGIEIDQFFNAGKYITGYHTQNTPTDHLNFYLTEEYIRVYDINKNIFFSIKFSDIKNITLEDKTTIESRVGFKRLLVAGIFAFAMKKKSKNEIYYLIIEYDRQGFTNEVYFEYEGKHMSQYASDAKNKIQNAIIKARQIISKPVKKSETYLFELKGVHIKERKSFILDFCSPSDVVEMENDPTNIHDKNAIKVLYEGFTIGFVPIYQTSEVKNIISTNQYIAKINSIKFDGDYLYVDIVVDY